MKSIRRRREYGGLTIGPDILIFLGIVALILLVAQFVMDRWRNTKEVQRIAAEFQTIISALQEYQSYYGNYPPEGQDFEDWTAGGTRFLPARIFRGKWNYACDNTNGIMTITSPPVPSQDAQTKLSAIMSNICDGGVSSDGTRLVCTIQDVSCPPVNAGGGGTASP